MSGLKGFLGAFARDERGTMVSDIGKAVIAIVFLSVIAAHVMSNRIEANEKHLMAAMSGTAASKGLDASPTGSLARDVSAVRIEPCVLPPKR